MTKTVVLIPYRGDGEWRTRNFETVLPRVEALGFDVFVGDAVTLGEPFSIARTWNMLSEKAGEWDKAIRWASDFIITTPESVFTALASDAHYTFCFDQALSLTKHETAEVHAGRPFPTRRGILPFGGVSVVTRALWDAVGGFDERFVGWGHEDRAFVHKVREQFGPQQRVPGRMLNLWHPKRKHASTDPYYSRHDENWALYQQIKRGRG